MDPSAMPEQLERPIWLLGHSLPANWVDDLDGPLDPRHPTRHSIWTPVLESLQDRVYRRGGGRRLDMNRCHIDNAAAIQPNGEEADWKLRGASIVAEKNVLASRAKEYKPKILITFSADVFWFASTALRHFEGPRTRITSEFMAETFNKAIRTPALGDPSIVPLLHAFVARAGWSTAGDIYSGTNRGNYFEFTGAAIGDLLLRHCRDLSIWIKRSEIGDT
jgi:hypothetical protein